MNQNLSEPIENEANEFFETMEISARLNQPAATKSTRIKPKADINFLNTDKSNKLIKVVENPKHLVAILLMMDCGLRVTECVTL